ncbi:Beta-giardin [Hexamita inflata]|uniref:Beta-giardin n=1 Tax=Hexamita inflata TaxID=28002 RepID=A0AA86PDQ5_9EUKA|nr:Beta-giardin [Hexamita inflata]
MFEAAKSLASVAEFMQNNPDASLLGIQQKHQKSNQDFVLDLKEQQQMDKNNMQLVSDGIDFLARLLVTERENQKGELDPLREELQIMAEELRSSLLQKIDVVKQSTQLQIAKVNENIDVFENALNAQIALRKANFKAMKQEFQKSKDDLDHQIIIEQQEREAQADALNILQQNVIQESKEQIQLQIQKSALQLKTEVENQMFQANLTQNIVVKKFTVVENQIQNIQKLNQNEKIERETVEKEIVKQIETIVDKITNGINSAYK